MPWGREAGVVLVLVLLMPEVRSVAAEGTKRRLSFPTVSPPSLPPPLPVRDARKSCAAAADAEFEIAVQ